MIVMETLIIWREPGPQVKVGSSKGLAERLKTGKWSLNAKKAVRRSLLLYSFIEERFLTAFFNLYCG